MPELTQERLKELLHYDPETGVFTRKVHSFGGHRHQQIVWAAGSVSGSKMANGYIGISLGGRPDGKLFKGYAHRLAWLYMTGKWPSMQIDHINGIRSDNRWGNLREAAPRVNSENRRTATAASGLLGAYKKSNATHSRSWFSHIQAHGITYYLGTFDTPEEAHAAYVAAKRKLHEGCTI